MMTVKVKVGDSSIHGTGIFAAEPILKGRVVWMLSPAVDRVLTDYAVKYAESRAQEFIRQRGYLNPTRPQWVICADEAQYWNFPRNGDEANTYMGDEIDGQKIVLAARDIAVGEELTIPPESDGDYARKMEQRK